MTTLDTVARSSAAAIHTSVSDVPIPLQGALGVGLGTALTALRYVVAGTALAGAVVAALMLAWPSDGDAPTASTPTTSVVTPASIVEQPTAPSTTIPLPSSPAPVVPPAGVDVPDATVDIEPPFISILSPLDGATLERSVVRFSGITEPGATVTASGKFAASVDGDGTWWVDLVLAPGANGVVFLAQDRAGNETEARMTVYFEVPDVTTTTAAPVTTTTAAPVTTTVAPTTTVPTTWEFVANQKYGWCEQPVPYDEFSGKATPGSTVTISSAYGGGSTVAAENGAWNLTVEFPSAPYNEVFTVTASDGLGGQRLFEFVSLYSG
jgi:hypothetical protein